MAEEKTQPAFIESDMWEYLELALDCTKCGRNTSRCICEDEDDD